MNLVFRDNVSLAGRNDASYRHLHVKPVTGALGAEPF
jgi:hypothetical protein